MEKFKELVQNYNLGLYSSRNVVDIIREYLRVFGVSESLDELIDQALRPIANQLCKMIDEGNIQQDALENYRVVSELKNKSNYEKY